MPTRSFECDSCGNVLQKLVAPGKTAAPGCSKCGDEMRPVMGAPTGASVVERLDNGAMPRAVERLANAPALFRERAEGGRGG